MDLSSYINIIIHSYEYINDLTIELPCFDLHIPELHNK